MRLLDCYPLLPASGALVGTLVAVVQLQLPPAAASTAPFFPLFGHAQPTQPGQLPASASIVVLHLSVYIYSLLATSYAASMHALACCMQHNGMCMHAAPYMLLLLAV